MTQSGFLEKLYKCATTLRTLGTMQKRYETDAILAGIKQIINEGTYSGDQN